MKPFNPDSNMDYDKSVVMFAREMGRLSGVIEGLAGKVDDIADNMMTRDSCINLVHDEMKKHESESHKKNSVMPQTGLTLRQKSALWGSLIAMFTGIATFLTSRFGS